MQFPDHTNAFEVDREGLKKLCDIFTAYCMAKIRDGISYVSSTSHNESDLNENKSDKWLTTQKRVSYTFSMYFNFRA